MMEQAHQARPSSWAKYTSEERCWGQWDSWEKRFCQCCSIACRSASSDQAVAPSLNAISNPHLGKALWGACDDAWVRGYQETGFFLRVPIGPLKSPSPGFSQPYPPAGVLHTQEKFCCWPMVSGAPSTLQTGRSTICHGFLTHPQSSFAKPMWLLHW